MCRRATRLQCFRQPLLQRIHVSSYLMPHVLQHHWYLLSYQIQLGVRRRHLTPCLLRLPPHCIHVGMLFLLDAPLHSGHDEGGHFRGWFRMRPGSLSSPARNLSDAILLLLPPWGQDPDAVWSLVRPRSVA